jgi:hypothetical protein
MILRLDWWLFFVRTRIMICILSFDSYPIEDQYLDLQKVEL